MNTSRQPVSPCLATIVALALVLFTAGAPAESATPVDAAAQVLTLTPADRASIDVARDAGGRISTIELRGDRYDGRRLIRALLAAPSAQQAAAPDLAIRINVATLTGFNDTALHDVALTLGQRDGAISAFALSAKLPMDIAVTGTLAATAGGRRVIRVETQDAGELLRFLNFYPHMLRGDFAFAIDAAGASQEGVLSIHNFAIRHRPPASGESSRKPAAGAADIAFDSLQLDFQRAPSALSVNDAVMRGPSLSATLGGKIDLSTSDVELRGAVLLSGFDGTIPLPFFPQPFTRPADAGDGFCYRLAGTLEAPRLRIDPLAFSCAQ